MEKFIESSKAFIKKTWPYVRAFLVGVGLVTLAEIVAGIITGRETLEDDSVEIYIEDATEDHPERLIIEDTSETNA